MDVGIRVRALVVIFAFFWVLAANNSQGIRHFSDILSEEDIPDIDEDKVEEVWLHCTRELLENTRGNANLIFYLSEVAGKNENVKLDRPQRVKEIMQKTINDLPTQERYLLLECLRSEAVLHNEYSMTWISKCQDFFSRWSTIPRRFLRGGRKHHHRGKKHHHRRGSRRNPLPLAQELNEEAPSPSPNNEGPASSPYSILNLHKAVNPPSYRAPASSPSIFLSQLSVLDSPQPLVPENAPSPAPSNGDHPSPTPSPPSPMLSPPPPMLSPPPPKPSPPSPKPSPSSPKPSAPSPKPSSPSPVSKPIIATPPVQAPPKSSSNHSPPKAVAHPPPPSTAQTGADIPSGGGKQKDDNYIIAVSVVGGLAALIGLALVFICIAMNRRKNSTPVEGQREEGKDEKPLLHFCSSDISAASSQQSCIMGKPGDKILKTSSAVGNLSAESDAQNSSKLETQSSEAAPGNNGSLLPLPPGKSAPPVVAAPPPPPPPKPAAPRAPPPPKMARPPPNPPKNGKPGPSPLGPHHRGKSSLDEGSESGDPDAPKAKLKPFFWDKVQANPDHSMVWHEIKEGSFQFNEEMMESLFGYIPSDKAKNENKKDSSNSQSQPTQIRIIDPKKAQNLAILLKALNVTTEEVCDALKEGNELPLELMQTLLKMAPTTDEELKLRLFSGDISQLGPAERFLKVIVDIPFAFKRLEALLFMCSLQEEVSSVMESFTTLEVACNELRNSRLFLKLLEAVLKTGNRMNDGTFRGGAMAFKLDTLLKLSDVKGTDGKTTLLLFVVQEIIRSEGVRAARKLRESQSMSNFKPEDLSEDSTQETEECHRKLGLEVVSGLSSELEDVKKAAVLDGEIITGTVSKLGNLLTKTKGFLNNELKTVEDAGELCDKLATFLEKAEADTTKLLEEDKRIMELVRNTGDYFHGNSGKDEGLRLFTIVRDFLVMLDKVCREVRSSAKWSSKPSAKKESISESHQESHNDSLSDTRQKLFPAIQERRIDDDSSSDDESSSP